MVGLGGISGSLAGGYLTDADIESWCFAARGLLGFIIAGVACTIDKSLEKDPTELVNASLWARTKSNIRDVWKGSKTPELYRSILYFIIMGCCIPNFNDFLYYYQITITGFTQLQYSYLQVLSYIALFASTFIYAGLLKNIEIRWMMVTALILNAIGAAGTVLFTTKHTFGLPPIAFICLTTTVTDTLYNAYTTLPATVLFAKLIPENVESSMFAMMTGLLNFSNLFMAKEVGIFINLFVGVYYYDEDDNNLEDVWKLFAIQVGCCFVPMFFVWLLPMKPAVKLVQIRLAEDAKAAEDARQAVLDSGEPLNPNEMLESIREETARNSQVVRTSQVVARQSMPAVENVDASDDTPGLR